MELLLIGLSENIRNTHFSKAAKQKKTMRTSHCQLHWADEMCVFLEKSFGRAISLIIYMLAQLRFQEISIKQLLLFQFNGPWVLSQYYWHWDMWICKLVNLFAIMHFGHCFALSDIKKSIFSFFRRFFFFCSIYEHSLANLLNGWDLPAAFFCV